MEGFFAKVTKMGEKKIINVPMDQHKNFDLGDFVEVTKIRRKGDKSG